jgi:hypothetical protein
MRRCAPCGRPPLPPPREGGHKGAPAQEMQQRLYRTPSFFCRLEDEVVYWNIRRLSGYT